MKSAVREIYDLNKAVSEWQWRCSPDFNAADKALTQIALKYKTYKDADIIEKGDIVSIAMISENKKFNRSTKLNVGSEIFDKGFEQFLIGKGKGNYTYEREGLKVEFEIKSISRIFIPELTPEMVEKEGIEGAKTPKGLRRYFIVKTLRESIDQEYYLWFTDYYLKKCKIDIDEQEVAVLVENEMNRCRDISKEMGEVFDELPPHKLAGAVGYRTIPEFIDMLKEFYTKNLSLALVAAALKGENIQILKQSCFNDYLFWLKNKVIFMVESKLLAEIKF